MIERLACKNGRNDEELNILLAEEICKEGKACFVKEMVDGAMGRDKAVANDCIKVLYEIGERKPELVMDYVTEFVSLLTAKNNRLVWGSMTALACITRLKGKEIYESIEVLKKVYQEGSVIAVDQSMTVFAELCTCDIAYEKELFPFLMEHLKNCRPKEVAQHAERISVCVNQSNWEEFRTELEGRLQDLSTAQIKRINKMIKLMGRTPLE